MMIFMQHAFCFAASFFFAMTLIPFIINAALRRSVVDVPDGALKKHEKPIPYLGGVAIYLAFIIPIALVYPCKNNILWFLLGATLLLFIGLIDDLLFLSPSQKLGGQFLAVVCFLRGGFALKSIFFSSTVNIALSAFWMLSVINAFNLIDIMDGLATTTALVASFVFFLIALYFKVYTVSLLLVSFMAALVGFLLYNKPPARIYMGDAGSLFIGGFLSAVPMLLPWSAQSFDAYYTPAVILAIPLIEITSLVVIRSYLGIPFYQGSPHHFALYLKQQGWTVRAILGFVTFFGSALGIVACGFLLGYFSFLWLSFCFANLLALWGLIVFGRRLLFYRIP